MRRLYADDAFGVGTVIAYNTVVVRSQIQGQLVSINFTEGQTVDTGNLLAQIDPRPYQAQIEQLTANLERDQAPLQNAQANLNRYVPLAGKGYATLVDTQKAQVAQLQAAVDLGNVVPRRTPTGLLGHADRADFADIHAPRDGSAANSAARRDYGPLWRQRS